MKLKGKHP